MILVFELDYWPWLRLFLQTQLVDLAYFSLIRAIFLSFFLTIFFQKSVNQFAFPGFLQKAMIFRHKFFLSFFLIYISWNIWTLLSLFTRVEYFEWISVQNSKYLPWHGNLFSSTMEKLIYVAETSTSMACLARAICTLENKLMHSGT